MFLKFKFLVLSVFITFVSYPVASQEIEAVAEETEQVDSTVLGVENTEIVETPQEQAETKIEAKVEVEKEVAPDKEKNYEKEESNEKYKLDDQAIEKLEKEKIGMEKKSQYRHALGAAAGFLGGYGISYKYYVRPDLSLQFTGIGYGRSDEDMTVNFGGIISKAVHKGKWESLLISLGTSVKREWSQDDLLLESEYFYGRADKTVRRVGFLIGLQLYSSNIGITGHLGNMFEHTNYHYANVEDIYAIQPTIEVSAHYYFR